ncbi:MFS transporter [Bordetella petrii]|uniref:MFS transporter n=1 Tax=Bordetella petrii TaxID=94624 RepID=UPI001E627A36|nr:MFS transporter [Bordetella petrii]MCD0501988.1 MFS transporter [Bordetella petrii]
MTSTEPQHVRRNARVLSIAQALGGASPAIIISLGGLVGQTLASQPALATLPVSMFHLGLALGTIPAAMLMRRYGRRSGYALGALLGILGGLVAAYGIAVGSFLLFCTGTALAGLYASYVQSYRFAVIDGIAPERRARAISWIMTAGLFAAVIGTQTVIWTRDALPAAPFAGSFLSQAGLALLALLVLSRLHNVPVAVADPQHGSGRPLSEIARQPRFIVAVVAGMVSYGLMSLVMTAAPMAMVGCGHTVGEAALGIQWHVLAMYLPSFFTGRLIERYGKARITILGLLLTASASAVALSGLGISHFWGMLVLLGLGWNFGFIGATALLTDCYRPEERTRAQALNDFLVFGSVAAASLASGRLLSVSGWDTVNQLVFPIVALVLALLLWQRLAAHRA